MVALPYDYAPEASALYIQLTDLPYAYGRDLEDERRVDFAADGTPIGVELTCVRSGVNVESLPAVEQIVAILNSLGLPVYA